MRGNFFLTRIFRVRDAFDKHLSTLFPNVSVVVIEADDHNCLRTGEPGDAIEIDQSVEVYPFPVTETRRSIGRNREVKVTKWAVDKLVSDSDPSVDLFGLGPVEHTTHDTLYQALAEVAALLARNQIELDLEAEGKSEQTRKWVAREREWVARERARLAQTKVTS